MPVVTSITRLGHQLRRLLSGISYAEATGQSTDPFTERIGYYLLLEAYYDNVVFADAKDARWGRYKRDHGLPRNIRILWNCTSRAVDWYPGALYPGGYSHGKALPWKEEDLEAKAALIEAVEQGLHWGNWRSEQYAWVAGSVLRGVSMVEIVDDVDRQKVYPQIIHPGLVAELDLSPGGFVRSYALEFMRRDGRGERYRYRKEVDKYAIRTFKDDRPFDYDGFGAERPNPYGFVNAVWTKNRNRGGVFGVSVIGPTIAKLEHLNSQASSIADYIMRFGAQGAIFATEADSSKITKILKGGATYAYDDPQAEREEVRVLKGPADLSIHRLIENLGLDEAQWFVERLIEEVEADLPELTVDKKLQEMTTLTGPGADRALSEVNKRFRESMTNHDASLVRIGQMLSSIGGWRFNSGDWAMGEDELTAEHQRFAPFDLDSYKAGALDFDLDPRPLIPLTEEEQVALVASKERITTAQGLRELYGKEGEKVLAEREQQQKRQAELTARSFDAGFPA